MDIAFIVDLASCIFSLVLTIISVVIVIITLRQNSKMLENESRAIYGDTINCKGTHFYLILKNFGKSAALITSLECDTDLSTFSYFKERVPFSHMENTLLAPNQSYKCALQQFLLFNSEISYLNFKISYQCNNKKYSDSFCINLKSYTDMTDVKPSPKDGKELEIMAYSLQELLEKLL